MHNAATATAARSDPYRRRMSQSVQGFTVDTGAVPSLPGNKVVAFRDVGRVAPDVVTVWAVGETERSSTVRARLA